MYSYTCRLYMAADVATCIMLYFYQLYARYEKLLHAYADAFAAPQVQQSRKLCASLLGPQNHTGKIENCFPYFRFPLHNSVFGIKICKKNMNKYGTQVWLRELQHFKAIDDRLLKFVWLGNKGFMDMVEWG